MTVSEVAAYLRAHDKYLILTHRRPDGDTLGCAAALCASCARWARPRASSITARRPSTSSSTSSSIGSRTILTMRRVVSVDLAALSLFPDNAEMFKTRVDLAIDHHPSYEGFGKESCVHPECAACGEILCELAQELGQLTPEVSAAALCRRVDRHGLLCLLQRHGEHAPRGRGADGDGHRL